MMMNSLQILKNKITKDFWEKCFFAVIVLNVVILLCEGLFSWGHFKGFCTSYVFFINLMYSAIYLYRCQSNILKKKFYLIALIFMIWYVVCVIMNGKPFLITDYFQPEMTMLMGAVCLAFPMVDMLNDFDKKKFLDTLLLLVLLFLVIFIWLAVILTLLRTSIWVGDKQVGYFILDNSYAYPVLFNHQYYTAALSVIGLFIGIYFLVKKRFRILAVLGLIGFMLALSLVKCRSALVGLTVGVMVSGFFLIRSRAPEKKWTKCIPDTLKLLIGMILVLIAMWEIGTLWANYLAKTPEKDTVISAVVSEEPLSEEDGQQADSSNTSAPSSNDASAVIDHSYQQRAFSDGLNSGTGRLGIYSRIPDLMAKGAPKSYIFGYSRSDVAQLYWDFLGVGHTHSIFFETLTQFGLPGMLLVIALLFVLWKTILRFAFRKTFLPLKPENCILPAIPAAFTVIGFFENFLFANNNFYPHYYFYNLIFFIFFGYFMEMDHHMREDNMIGLI